MRAASVATCALLSGSAHGFLGTGVTARAAYSRGARLAMALKEGDMVPMDAVFNKIVDGKPTAVPAADLFAGKKVAVCGVPGAMTPTCSESHLPGFAAALDELKSKGVDTVACIAVNDPFVMSAWGKKLDLEGKIEMLADGGASFAKAIGHEMDTKDFGGIRLKRMAMLVNDGVVQKLGVEDGGGFTEVSNVKALLDAL